MVLGFPLSPACPSTAFVTQLHFSVRSTYHPRIAPPLSTTPQIVCAKRRSNRRRKASESKPSKPTVPQTSSSGTALPTDDTLLSSAPVTDNDLSEDGMPTVPMAEELPVVNEARLKLPDLNSASRRRKRKPLQKPVEEPVREKEVMATEAVQRLTAAYRAGGDEAQKVIDELEKDPDYFLQTGNAKGEYDFASALIGTGRPNKQGIYVLPYLQSGHVLLLGIALLVAFIYYPGFPLTEASDETRELLRKGLALVGVVNAVLAVFAYRAAKLRAQPPLFWALKTVILGNLAFNELKTNAPIRKDSEE